MSKRIVVVGAGAVGGYFGAHLALTGEDVTLVDPWPEHVETIRRQGLSVTGMTDEETICAKPRVLHLTEVQGLSKEKPVDIAIIATKSYDTTWATMMIAPYLASDGYVVSAQNSITKSALPASSVGVAFSAAWSETTSPSTCMRRGTSAAPCREARMYTVCRSARFTAV